MGLEGEVRLPKETDMLVNLKEMLTDATRNRYGVGCINAPNTTYLRALIDAAEEVNIPLVIDHAEVHDPLIPLERIAPDLIGCARRAKVPVAVHVDHGESMNFIMRGVNNGFTSVMYDCSKLTFEENVSRVKAFIERVRPAGISVEAELGEMPTTLNDTHGGSSASTAYTDPDLAHEFVERTGVDALAVTFGTSHGIYEKEPVLDFEHLKRLREATGETPLVMHGSSGVPLPDITKAVAGGISKVNYYSYLAVESSRFAGEVIEADRAEGRPTFYHELVEKVYVHTKAEAKKLYGAFLNGFEYRRARNDE